MAEGDPPQTPDLAVRAFIGLFVLGCVLHGFDMMKPEGVRSSLRWWAAAALLAIFDWYWIKIKSLLGPRFAATANKVATDFRWWVAAVMLVFAFGIGSDIYRNFEQSPSPQPTSSPAAAPFTPAWLTLDNRQNTFKSGVLSIINAAGNLPPTKIETVAEPQSESFARALVDMFILSGFQPRDFGQGDYVGTPTTHRLAAGITIVAPVPSLAAEALRVGFERIGIQTRRSTDHSRTDDYLVVEVGPAP